MKKPNLTSRNEVFNEQVQTTVVHSRYDLTEKSVGSFRMGILYPIYCRNDIHPGDTFKMSSAPFIRFLPMVSPALTDVDVEVRYFFVPRRLVWDRWKNFISPSSETDVLLVEPYIPNFMGNDKLCTYLNISGTIFDYMGEPSLPRNILAQTSGVLNVVEDKSGIAAYANGSSSYFGWRTTNESPIHYSAYPYAAYNMIYNEYFRDENLNPKADDSLSAGSNASSYQEYILRRVNWEKDYFTSSLPFAIQSIMTTPTVSSGDTIEELREMSALTRWLEKQALGGHRYQESILTHFGVRVPDEAAQIPIYLGGGRCPVQIGAVEQNSETNITPQATLAGRGTAAENMFIENCYFKEHGTILGLMYIRPRALYADVMSRDLFPKGRNDYMWPDFANLGEEAVKSDELNPGLFTYGFLNDFGYQDRYQSFRTSFDRVHGQLRPFNELESWTQSRNWNIYNGSNWVAPTDIPQITSDFIACDPSNRIFAVTSQDDNMIGEIVTMVDAVRPIPNYINPKIE